MFLPVENLHFILILHLLPNVASFLKILCTSSLQSTYSVLWKKSTQTILSNLWQSANDSIIFIFVVLLLSLPFLARGGLQFFINILQRTIFNCLIIHEINAKTWYVSGAHPSKTNVWTNKKWKINCEEERCECSIVNNIKAYIKKYISRNFSDDGRAVSDHLMNKPCKHLPVQSQQ